LVQYWCEKATKSGQKLEMKVKFASLCFLVQNMNAICNAYQKASYCVEDFGVANIIRRFQVNTNAAINLVSFRGICSGKLYCQTQLPSC
jgi:hypothetical protein